MKSDNGVIKKGPLYILDSFTAENLWTAAITGCRPGETIALAAGLFMRLAARRWIKLDFGLGGTGETPAPPLAAGSLLFSNGTDKRHG